MWRAVNDSWRLNIFYNIFSLILLIKTTRKINSPIYQTYSWNEGELNLFCFWEYGSKKLSALLGYILRVPTHFAWLHHICKPDSAVICIYEHLLQNVWFMWYWGPLFMFIWTMACHTACHTVAFCKFRLVPQWWVEEKFYNQIL